MTAAGRESAVAEALDALRTAIMRHEHRVSLPDGKYVLWSDDVQHEFNLALAALDTPPALGDDERAALTALVDKWAAGTNVDCMRAQELRAILTARAHQPTPPGGTGDVRWSMREHGWVTRERPAQAEAVAALDEVERRVRNLDYHVTPGAVLTIVREVRVALTPDQS